MHCHFSVALLDSALIRWVRKQLRSSRTDICNPSQFIFIPHTILRINLCLIDLSVGIISESPCAFLLTLQSEDLASLNSDYAPHTTGTGASAGETAAPMSSLCDPAAGGGRGGGGESGSGVDREGMASAAALGPEAP